MKIRCAVLALFALLLYNSSSAQIFDKSRGKNVKEVISSPLLLHTTGTAAFDERLKSSFDELWKVGPYELFDASKKYDANEKAVYGSFMPAVLGALITRETPGGSYTHGTQANHPFFLYGPADRKGNVSGDEVIAALPINSFHYEFDVTADHNMFSRCLLRIPYMVATLNDMLTWIKEKGNEKGYLDEVNKRAPQLAKKTLIIPKDLVTEWNVNPNTTALEKGRLSAGKKPMKEIMHQALDEADISYGGKFKIMTNKEIMKLEKDAGADKYALFLPAVSEHKHIMAYDLKTKQLLYYNQVTMGLKVKEKDFDRMNTAIGL